MCSTSNTNWIQVNFRDVKIEYCEKICGLQKWNRYLYNVALNKQFFKGTCVDLPLEVNSQTCYFQSQKDYENTLFNQAHFKTQEFRL